MFSRAGSALALALLAGACAGTQASRPQTAEPDYDCGISVDTDEGRFEVDSSAYGLWRSSKLGVAVSFSPPLVNGQRGGQSAPSSVTFQFGYEFGVNVYKQNRPFGVRVRVGDRVRAAEFDRHQVNAHIRDADLSYLLEGEGDVRATLHTARGEALQEVVLARPALERVGERLASMLAQVREKERDPKTMCREIDPVIII